MRTTATLGELHFRLEVIGPGDALKRIRDMTTKVTTFPSRRPISLKLAIEKVAAVEGISVNKFPVMAAAEKPTAIQTTESFFARRKGRGDKQAAVRFLTRSGGEPRRVGEELL